MKKNQVPNFYYNIDGKGRDDERFCLVKDGEKWNVYYSERGVRPQISILIRKVKH